MAVQSSSRPTRVAALVAAPHGRLYRNIAFRESAGLGYYRPAEFRRALLTCIIGSMGPSGWTLGQYAGAATAGTLLLILVSSLFTAKKGRVAMHRTLEGRLSDAVPGMAADTHVVVIGRGGSWLRSLIPGLWSSSQRILAVGKGEVILLAAGHGYKTIKRQLWRGPHAEVRLRSYLDGRAVRLRMPNGRRVQIDGRHECQRVLDASDAVDER